MKLDGLPFQYNQRAGDLIKATPEQTAAITEQRDQDLENYLAGLRTLPPGGLAGQVLTKASNADYDVDWETPSGGSSALPYFIWYGHQYTSGIANASTFNSNSTAWDTYDLQDETGLSIAVDARNNPVLAPGSWLLTCEFTVYLAGVPTDPATGYSIFEINGSASPHVRENLVQPGAFMTNGIPGVGASGSTLISRIGGSTITTKITNETGQGTFPGLSIPMTIIHAVKIG